MAYLAATRARAVQLRAAFAQAEGMPRRGVVVGGVDMLPQAYAPGAAGWTDQALETPVDGATNACLEIPADMERHLGTTVSAVTIPARATLAEEASLPTELRDKVRERKGQNPDGSPRDPFEQAGGRLDVLSETGGR